MVLEFSPGMRVIIRDEEWMIKKVETNSLDRKTLFCSGISTLVKDRPAIFLADLENVEIVDPADIDFIIDESSNFRKSRLFIESKWRQQIPTDSKLHIGHRAAMDSMQFQLLPACLALRNIRQRILIADAVGLGKTLEAGILISELMARGKGKKILVVTVKSMMTQFQKELWNRFTIPLARLDSRKIASIRSKLPANYNPFHYFDKTIISMDTLKRDIEYRTHLENSYWDIIVIDEAHNVAERGGSTAQRARLAKLLAERSDTLIMLSATPHDGRSQSFASLMNMLDPTAVANPNDYSKADIQGLCVRRHKKDIRNQILDSFKERAVHTEECKASPVEEHAFQILAEMVLEMDKSGSRTAGRLFKTTLEKALFSSPAACIKSIEERLRKLRARVVDEDFNDIVQLKKLKSALEQITSSTFSRYQRLLSLLNSDAYGWNADRREDRIVIFTERIETMRYLANRLRRDLNLHQGNAVQELYGGMNDAEQQRIVEEFGMTESPVRILVASDVASEGINLHYLSHRLIHFDIPWSLMVFQQRNGRIDRYGQKERPDIRYFLISSDTQKIGGDTRILEILIEKEKQAYANIGDPALLMNKFNQDEEEMVTAEAIEEGKDAEEFVQTIDELSMDPFEAFFQDLHDADTQPEIAHVRTLYSDLDYLKSAMDYFSQTERYHVSELETVQGLEISITGDLKERLKALLPEEALSDREYLRLSPDKTFCMSEMGRSMQSNLEDTAWPETQFLWSLHPIFDWVNDKASLLFERNSAPLIGLTEGINPNEFIFIISGSIPNRKSTAVIDEWFGIHVMDGRFVGTLAMDQIIERTRFGRGDVPNPVLLTTDETVKAKSLLPTVIKHAKEEMGKHSSAYRERINSKINDELLKLDELQRRHLDFQLAFFTDEDKKSAKSREVERKFEQFVDWVNESLEIEEKPYLRVIAAITGVN